MGKALAKYKYTKLEGEFLTRRSECSSVNCHLCKVQDSRHYDVSDVTHVWSPTPYKDGNSIN